MIKRNYNKLQLIANSREVVPMEETGMRLVCFFADQDTFSEGEIPWHWHTVMEISYVAEGELELQTIGGSTTLKKGEAAFINSGVLHGYRLQPGADCGYYSLLFDSTFLSGTHGNILEEKYILPIQQSQNVPIWPIRPGAYADACMLHNTIEAIELCRNEPFGYEFRIRQLLCELWCELLEATEAVRLADTGKHQVDMDRMKKMILFIQERFAERLSLEDIAAAADISARECTRCFQRSIGCSPMSYLNDYRLEAAAELLLATADSVTEISENCGFSSASYFGKAFREKMGSAPLAFRKGRPGG